jgi:hypothetical protein
MAPASAATPGVGTAATTTQVLTAAIGNNGSLLNLNLLGDAGRATTDKAVAPTSAFSQLIAAQVSSAVVPALNVSIPVTPLKASAPEGTPTAGLPATALPTPAVIASGMIDPATLTASVVDGVAKSALGASVSNLSVVGGLIGVEKVGATLGTSVNADAAEAVRTVEVTNVKVLDLAMLLQGLGIQLPNLSVAQITALVDGLAATAGLNLPSGTTTLTGAVSALNAAVDGLQATIDVPAGQVTSTVTPAVAGLLSTVGITAPATTSVAVSTVNAVINQAQAVIDDLLVAGINNLIATPLLRLDGVKVGIDALAMDTVGASKADVTGTVGSVHIGGITIAGVDALSTATQVAGVVNNVQSQLAGVLSIVSPDLAGLVKVSVLDKVSEVSNSNGYVHAKAGVTGLTVTITPPATLGAVLTTISGQTNQVGSLLGSSVPALSSAMNTLSSTLSLGFGALSQGGTIKVASVLGASDFARVGVTTGAPTPGNELPRTGGTAGLALFGAVAAVLGLGARRLFRQPAMRTVGTK